MTTAAAPSPDSMAHGVAPAVLACAASAILHALLFVAILRLPGQPMTRPSTPVTVEIVETPAPVPAPAPPRVEAPAAPPRAVRPPARVTRAPSPAAPQRPPEAPPPPHAPAPEPSAAAQPRIGISMSSTTAAGTYAAPVGNTAMGQAPPTAGEPSQVKPYRAERYAPPAELSSLPVPVRVDLPKSEYPPDALREGFEGAVRLRLVVDEEGNVREATVVSDPGHGLGAAAARAAKRWFRFRPARKDGVTVATEIPFTVEFQLQ